MREGGQYIGPEPLVDAGRVPQAVRLENGVGIEKAKELAGGRLREPVTGVGLSEPPFREWPALNNLEPLAIALKPG